MKHGDRSRARQISYVSELWVTATTAETGLGAVVSCMLPSPGRRRVSPTSGDPERAEVIKKASAICPCWLAASARRSFRRPCFATPLGRLRFRARMTPTTCRCSMTCPRLTGRPSRAAASCSPLIPTRLTGTGRARCGTPSVHRLHSLRVSRLAPGVQPLCGLPGHLIVVASRPPAPWRVRKTSRDRAVVPVVPGRAVPR